MLGESINPSDLGPFHILRRFRCRMTGTDCPVFTVIGAIDRHGRSCLRARCNQDTRRRLHNLIALASRHIEHTGECIPR